MKITTQQSDPMIIRMCASVAISIVLTLIGTAVQAEPLDDVSLREGEKCGWGPFGQRTYLVNNGESTVEVIVEKRLLAAPRDAQPETQRYVVSSGESIYIGCTRTMAKRGPVYKYSVADAKNAN